MPVLVGGCWGLARCAGLFVDRSVRIARWLKVSNIFIGIVLLALATTLPEMVVSISSALQKRPEIALGNAMGSILCNAGLALGLCAIAARRPIPVLRGILGLSGGFLLGLATLVFVMIAHDRTLTRGEGLVLLGLLGLYYVALFRRRQPPPTPAAPACAGTASPPGLLAVFGLALLGVFIASRLVLAAAIGLAASLRIPTAIIALTVIALGTSIPEIATCVAAGRRGHGDIAIGNILGANILNISWIAGGAAVVQPLTLNDREFYVMLPSMWFLATLSLVMLYTHTVLTKREGWWLLGAYLAVVTLLIGVFARIL